MKSFVLHIKIFMITARSDATEVENIERNYNVSREQINGKIEIIVLDIKTATK